MLIEVLFCNVCHSDIQQVDNDWKNTLYPCVTGHEIIGKVTATGNGVTKCKVGDTAGAGCMDACQHCPVEGGEEQFCQGEHGANMTYNGYWKPDASKFNTCGGYSKHIVAKKSFVLQIPEKLILSAAAPILCAGVITYFR